MNLLKRGKTGETATPEALVPDTVPVGLGKGRPTPKRRDAEARRRGPVPPPPTTQREAYKRSKVTGGTKEDRRSAAKERRARIAAGDDRYVLARDRGPVRALVRDVVDSRRNLAGLFMPFAVLLVVSLVLAPAIQAALSFGIIFYVVVIAVEGIYLSRLVGARVDERFPDETHSRRKLGLYAVLRASQLRRLRSPSPRVKPGDPV